MQQRRRARRRRGARPVTVVEGRARGRDRGRVSSGPASSISATSDPSAGQRISRRSPSRALVPSAPDVELRHVHCPIRRRCVAYVATRVLSTQQQLRLATGAPSRLRYGRSRNQVVARPRRRCPATTGDELLDARARASRKVGPETLSEAITSPCALRIGAATAVSPTSSSSTATAYPCSRTSASSRRSRDRLVTVSRRCTTAAAAAGCRPRRRRAR